VIVPVFNSAATLEACIGSIDANTYPDDCMRVFLIDKGSKDQSLSIFTCCQRKFPGLRKDLRRFYVSQWWVVLLLPLFNLITFFIRFAGIINSLGMTGVWKTCGLAKEWADFGQAFRKEFVEVGKPIVRLRLWANAEAVDQKEAL
jgi:cellulose synthase/poly-beta-1,6-N-acetylglucosamine synthase-like glycosyltransferase